MKRNVFLKGLASYSFANLVMYILSLVTVPLFISYFGLTKYGLWIVLLSLISYLANSQFGLNTVVAVLLSKSDDRSYHKTVLTRSLDLLLIAAGIILIAGFIFYLQPSGALALIGKVPADFSNEVLISFFYLVLFFALRLPLSVITAGFIGHQDVQLERLYIGILPQILSFVALLITRRLDGNLVTLAQIIGIGNLAIAIGSAIHYKIRYNYLYAFSKASLLAEPSKNQILKNGGIFFVAGLSGMIITNTDNIILSQFFGADQVAGYSLVFKILYDRLFYIFYSKFSILAYFRAGLRKKRDRLDQNCFR